MKPKTKFMKMFYKLPNRAKSRLVHNPYGKKPATLNVIAVEVRNDTKFGKDALKDLGYTDLEA